MRAKTKMLMPRGSVQRLLFHRCCEDDAVGFDVDVELVTAVAGSEDEGMAFLDALGEETIVNSFLRGLYGSLFSDQDARSSIERKRYLAGGNGLR